MKRIIVLTMAALFLSSVASFSFAEYAAPPASKKEEKSPEKTAAPKEAHITGVIKVIDTPGKTITVTEKIEGKEHDVVIAVSDKMLAGLKSNEKVDVEYTIANGKNTARKITRA